MAGSNSASGEVNLSLTTDPVTVLASGNTIDPSSYTASSASGTDYTVSSAPEPSTYAALLGGIAMLTLRRRRSGY